jgi:putative membrane protein
MPSEGRLHPLSFLFEIGGQLRQLVVPGIVLLVGAGSAGFDWQVWLLLLVLPSAAIALVRTLSVRYRFEASELVITSGFIFRHERHVPYARIQNIDAVQNLAHRLAGVVEVRVETGGGDEPEASLRVLPRAALDEMRERVFEGREPADPFAANAADEGGTREAARALLRLRPRDLLLAGFIESRGLIIVTAAFGLLWEAGLLDPAVDTIAGKDVDGRGVVRQVVRAFAGGGIPSFERVAIGLGAFALLLLAMRVLSMIWSLIRLHGFRLERRGEDLRAEYGLITRVMMTVPLRRIQTLTIREGPLHRLFKAVMVKVDSAGSDKGERGTARRESLAPILEKRALPALLRDILPDVDVSAIDWQPVDPRGFRRALKVSCIFYAFVSLPFVLMLGWWTLALVAVLWAWAFVEVTLHIRSLGWAVVDRAVLFKRGWLTREVRIARFSKIQAVTLVESPFDRRHRMASVRVDTAGADDAAHHVGIPYLARATAETLRQRLAAYAAQTSFRW